MRKFTILTFALLVIGNISNAQTTFTNSQSITIAPPEGTAPYAIKSADLDGDNDLDLVVGTDGGNSIIWFKNDGTGNFIQEAIITNTLSGVLDLELVNIDGSAGVDIVAASFGDGKLVYFANDPNNLGSFGSEQVISSNVGGAGDIETGLINGDAFLDVAVSAFNDNKVVWFANNGTGSFGTENIIDNTIVMPGSFDLQDIDMDGDLDAVISNAVNQMNNPGMNTSVIEVFFNNALTFTKDMNSVINDKDYIFNVSFEDINPNDNTSLTTDILASDLFGAIYHYNKNAMGDYIETTITTSLANPASIGFYDLDISGDGLKDILVSSGTFGGGNNDLIWFKNNGSGNFSGETIIDASQNNPYKYVVDDFDNDGDLDIASVDYSGSPQVNIFNNQKIVLGINENSLEDMTVYPNPAIDVLYVKFNGLSNLDFEIHDLLGKKLSSGNISSDDAIDVSNLKAGLYFLKFKDVSNSFKFVRK